MHNPIRRWAVIPAIAAALVLPLQAQADEEYVEVSGNGEISAWPDFVTLTMTISATANDAASAKQQVDAQVNQLLAVASNYAISEEDIDASRIHRQPVWEWKREGREYRGEQVSRPVTLTLRDTNQYGALSHDVIAIKGLSLNGQTLGFADRKALEQQAMTLALLDARDKAKHMATTLGTGIEEVLSIIEQSGSSSPMMEGRVMAAMAKSSEPAPMLIQEQKIRTSVLVRFELDD